jgi:hypothetical protein
MTHASVIAQRPNILDRSSSRLPDVAAGVRSITAPAQTARYDLNVLVKSSAVKISHELCSHDTLSREHRYRAELKALARDLNKSFARCRRRNAALAAWASTPIDTERAHESSSDWEGREYRSRSNAVGEYDTSDQSLSEAVNALTRTLARLGKANGRGTQRKTARRGRRRDSVAAPPHDLSASSSASEGSSSTIRPWTADCPTNERAELRTAAITTQSQQMHPMRSRRIGWLKRVR